MFKTEPSDATLIGTGKLKLNILCKEYGFIILIQAQLTISTNNTGKDIILQLPLKFDCCEVQGKNFSFNNTFQFTVDQCNSSFRRFEGSQQGGSSRKTDWRTRLETETLKYGLSSFLSLLCGNGYYDLNLFHSVLLLLLQALL